MHDKRVQGNYDENGDTRFERQRSLCKQINEIWLTKEITVKLIPIIINFRVTCYIKTLKISFFYIELKIIFISILLPNALRRL